eukprot:TRINITY_DN1898_c0_g1_i3.p1 TRINITY_DN1898_c0_g1~~TRINITY_DN1898_c0_g1_i3.p1  ORF type:complete len:245 (-),score=53.77 TRINITY_DN1898_c0_g1_i3:664-1398(-)
MLFFLFLSPEVLVWNLTSFQNKRFEIQSILKHKSTGKRSAAPYVASLLNILLSAYFGSLLGDSTINLVNIINFVIVVMNFIVFFMYYPEKNQLQNMLGVVLATLVAVVTLSFALAQFEKQYQLTFLGIVANLGSILMFLSPLANLNHVRKSKDSSVLSPLTVSFALACSGSWLVYGLLLQNVFVYLPNIVGLLISLVQIYYLLKYPRAFAKSTKTIIHSPGLPHSLFRFGGEGSIVPSCLNHFS